MKIGVIGSGIVGETLANGFLKHGYEVMRASRDASKLSEWKSKAGSKAQLGSFLKRPNLVMLRCWQSKGAPLKARFRLLDQKI